MSDPGRELAKAERPASGLRRRRDRVSLTDVCVQMLTDAIERGVYSPGSPLPSETDLAEQLEVSRATLREALRTLGRSPAHRPPARPRHVRQPGADRQGPAPQLRHHGHDPHRRLPPRYGGSGRHQRPRDSRSGGQARARTRRPGHHLAPHPPGRQAPGRAVRRDPPRTRPVPADLEQIGTAYQSLYAYLYRHRGIGIYRGLAELTPVKATTELAAALDVRRGDLLICMSQVDYDETGKAVMYAIEYHLPDWVRFSIERIGPGSAVDD